MRSLRDIDLKDPSNHTAVYEIYAELVAEAREAVGGVMKGHPDGYFPHNVGMVREWIMVIPRRTNNFEEVTANTAGMLGSVWLTSDAQLARWKKVGPKRALAGLGVPAEHARD